MGPHGTRPHDQRLQHWPEVKPLLRSETGYRILAMYPPTRPFERAVGNCSGSNRRKSGLEDRVPCG